MMAKALQDMTVDELTEFIQECMAQRTELKGRQLEASRIRDQKVAEAEAAARVEAMSDIERAALLQVLQPTGIPSKESVKGIS
jgi:hypothetical protein